MRVRWRRCRREKYIDASYSSPMSRGLGEGDGEEDRSRGERESLGEGEGKRRTGAPRVVWGPAKVAESPTWEVRDWGATSSGSSYSGACIKESEEVIDSGSEKSSVSNEGIEDGEKVASSTEATPDAEGEKSSVSKKGIEDGEKEASSTETIPDADTKEPGMVDDSRCTEEVIAAHEQVDGGEVALQFALDLAATVLVVFGLLGICMLVR